jgi:hypothetical protein
LPSLTFLDLRSVKVSYVGMAELRQAFRNVRIFP